MNIPDTTTEAGRVEASILLAELCGWITSDGLWHRYMPPSGAGASVNHAKGQEITTIFALCPTLYNPANMALAWRALNWAMSCDHLLPEQASSIIWIKYRIGVRQFNLVLSELVDMDYASTLSPSEAMRYWLDKILTLAIEAGMIT